VNLHVIAKQSGTSAAMIEQYCVHVTSPNHADQFAASDADPVVIIWEIKMTGLSRDPVEIGEKFIEQMLVKLCVLPLKAHRMFIVPHGDQSAFGRVRESIKKEVGASKGVYIYFQKTERQERCLYVGKGAPLYNRLWCHYQESIFEPHGDVLGIMGDSKKGLWPAFFRDAFTGPVQVYWLEISDELDRQIIELALHKYLAPEFIAFQKNFDITYKKNLKEQRNRKSG
jgi:hypothetical protein